LARPASGTEELLLLLLQLGRHEPFGAGERLLADVVGGHERQVGLVTSMP
jgi:hypothetical protein